MHTPQTEPTKIPEAYGAAEVSAHIKERFRIQSWIGASVACAAIISLIGVVGLVVYLAIDERSADYIEGVVQPLQPYLLPVIGAVVGYALGERER